MRRLLLVFLLLFMPFQSIWAAASPYCEHEAAPRAWHFGHHAHEHHTDADSASSLSVEPAESKGLTSSGMVDMDCHACHGAGNAMVWSWDAHAIVVAVAHPGALIAPVLVHPPLSRPERPNWPPLA